MGFSRALAAVVNIAVAISPADKIFNIVINLLHSNTKSVCSVSEVRIDAGDPNARLAHSPSIRGEPLRKLSDQQAACSRGQIGDGYSPSRNADRPLLELGAARADRSNQLVCGPRTETRLPSAKFSIGFRIT